MPQRIHRPNHKRPRGAYWVAMENFERNLLEEYITRFESHMPTVAGALGIALQTLYYRCRKLKIGRYAVGKKAT